MAGKRSKAELAAAIAELQAEMDSADEDDEIWVKHPDGHEVRVRGRKASNVLKSFGSIFDDPAPAGDEGEEGEEGDELPDDEQPGGGDGGYFRGRGKGK